MSFAHQHVAELGEFARQSCKNTNACVLSLVRDQPRNGKHDRRVADSPRRTKSTCVLRRRENPGVSPKIERSDWRNLPHPDLLHDRASQIRDPLRCRSNSRCLPENSSRRRSLERALPGLHLLTEKIAAVYVNDVRNFPAQMRPRHRVSNRPDVAAVNDVDKIAAIICKPPRPPHLVREPVGFVEVEWLAMNRVRFTTIEDSGTVKHHRRYFHRIRRVPEAATQLDMTPCHSPSIWRVVLSHEQVPEGVS